MQLASILFLSACGVSSLHFESSWHKLAVLAYRCLHGLAPAYLADVLLPVTDLPGRRRLRSSSTSAVVVPSTRLRTIGDRAFRQLHLGYGIRFRRRSRRREHY